MDGAHDLSIPRRLEAWIAEYDAKVSEIPASLAAYEAEARRRGIDPHEVTAIAEIRRKMKVHK